MHRLPETLPFRMHELTTDTLHGTRSERLSLLADRFHLTHPGAAAGRCLSASLDFAVAARQEHGIDVQLVKWRVVADPNYGDHWAVALDETTVIDLTHVQIDPALPLIGEITRYPGNFHTPQRYPASLLIDGYVAAEPHEARLSLDFLWLCGTRVLRFDLAAAARAANVGAALAALAEFGRFFLRFNAQRLSRALERRAQTLLGRLSSASEDHRPGRADGAPKTLTAITATLPPHASLSPALNPERYARVGQAFTPALAAPINSACSFLLAWASLTPVI